VPTLKGRKGLGRGLSALIPDEEMQSLRRIARGDTLESVTVTPPKRPKSPVFAGSSVNSFVNSFVNSPLRQPQKTVQQQSQSEAATSDAPQSAADRLQAEGPDRGEPIAIPEKSVASDASWARIEQIQPNPYQPRRAFNPQDMEELAGSLREHGVLQPILVRPVATLDDESRPAAGQLPAYQIVAGERRWRAARMAGLTQVPIIVREVADQQALELALIENVQRHDITPMDAALAYLRLTKEFGLSQEGVANRVGKSRAAIANTLRLLDLPGDIQKAIEEGAISEGHGRAILLAPGEGARRALFRHVIRDKLSVRDTEEAARKTSSGSGEGDLDRSPTGTSSQGESAHIEGKPGARRRNVEARRTAEVKRFEARLQDRLKTRVRLQPRTKGGQIIIEYFSNDDLERLLPILGGESS
jgi:ParB family chromosome partitioning protein